VATTTAIPGQLSSRVILPFPMDTSEEHVVDASQLDWIEPMGLVQLVLLMHHAAQLSPSVVFVAPNRYDLNHYLARMGFYDHIPESVERQNAIDPAAVHRRKDCDVLIPIKSFMTAGDVEELVEGVTKFLQRMVSDKAIPGAIYSTLREAIPELAGNAASHARSPHGGYMAAQTYGRGSYLAVADLGVGIRQHLTRNPQWAFLKTDEEAVTKAMESGVSGTSDRRGYGFDYVLDELEQTAGAELYVRSGNGWVKTTVTKSGRRRTSGTDPLISYPGTIIQLFIRS
jgi:hypothetical protein